jgi:lipopolysaccharide transport system permease protein
MSQKIETIINARKRYGYNWAELLSSRHLFYFFTWRNFKIRYKQTAIGVAWAVIQPFILMVVFTLFFNRIAGIGTGSDDTPYPIFSFAGLIFWSYFSQTTNQVSNSLVAFQEVIKKIYFPRIIAPVSTAMTGLVDMGFSLIIYFGLMVYYKISPTFLGVLLFLPMIMLSFITVLGLGLFLAALNLKYRDVGQALPFFIQTMLFMTPVIYPVKIVSEKFRWILFLNPMAGVIETVRASLLGTGSLVWGYLLISIFSSLLMLFIGFRYFHKKEREFADLI